MNKQNRKLILRYLLFVVLFILIRNYFLFIAQVSSNSMASSLYKRDIVLLTKFSHKSPFMNASISINDVVVFYHPTDTKKKSVKRVIGLPGDTIEIQNNIVLRNNMILQESEDIMKEIVLTLGENKNELFFSHISNYPYNIIFRQRDTIGLTTTTTAIQSLIMNGITDSFSIIDLSGRMDSLEQIKTNLWYMKNFGPVIIPKIGRRVELDKTNIHFYKNLIRKEVGNLLQIGNDRIMISGVEINSYTFESDAYFLLGDNRDNSLDSRIWGCVTKEDIIGKAVIILVSFKKKTINNMKRFLKRIL